MKAISFLNYKRYMSYSRIAQLIGISKPQLRKYMKGQLPKPVRSTITRKLNYLVKASNQYTEMLETSI